MRVVAPLMVLGVLAASLAAQDTTTSAPSAPAPSTLNVEAALARSVVDRTPQDTGSMFPAEVGELILWTRVTGAEGETAIRHVWFHGQTEVANVELRVGGSPWRTWSRKSIAPGMTGEWRVEIRDVAGNVLKSINFTVGQATGT